MFMTPEGCVEASYSLMPFFVLYMSEMVREQTETLVNRTIPYEMAALIVVKDLVVVVIKEIVPNLYDFLTFVELKRTYHF